LSRGTLKDALSSFPNQQEVIEVFNSRSSVYEIDPTKPTQNYGLSLFESNERMDLKIASAAVDWMLEKDSMIALGHVWCKLIDKILSLDGILPDGILMI
jgi:hypothetical protein